VKRRRSGAGGRQGAPESARPLRLLQWQGAGDHNRAPKARQTEAEASSTALAFGVSLRPGVQPLARGRTAAPRRSWGRTAKGLDGLGEAGWAKACQRPAARGNCRGVHWAHLQGRGSSVAPTNVAGGAGAIMQPAPASARCSRRPNPGRQGDCCGAADSPTTMPALLPWRSPWPRGRACAQSPVTKQTWARAMAQRGGAARALPVLGCGALPRCAGRRRRAACEIGPCVFRAARAWPRLVCQRQRKNAPAAPLAARWLTTPDLCLGHGEQASIARARRASRQVVWGLAGIEAASRGTLRSLRFQWLRSSDRGQVRARVAGRAKAVSLNFRPKKRSCR